MDQVILQIINSKRYVKLRPLRYSLYFLCILLFFTTIRPIGGRLIGVQYRSIAEYLSIPSLTVYTVVFVLVILAIFLYGYSKNYEMLGTLIIDNEQVSICLKNTTATVYPIPDLQNFKVSRGSTVHHETEDRYPPETSENWISFTYNGIDYIYEFCIDSLELNKEFEKVVYGLREKYESFYFESI